MKCLLVISFLFISNTFGRMWCKGNIYKSHYQILSNFRPFKVLVFGSKTAFKTHKRTFLAIEKKYDYTPKNTNFDPHTLRKR